MTEPNTIYKHFFFVQVVSYKCVEIFKEQELLRKPHQNISNTIVEVKRITAGYLKECA